MSRGVREFFFIFFGNIFTIFYANEMKKQARGYVVSCLFTLYSTKECNNNDSDNSNQNE